MGTLLQDFRYGLRLLRKNPGFTLVAVVTLALGIGANTAIFNVVNAVLLNPFPYADPKRLMFISETFGKLPGTSAVAYPDFLDFRKENRSFEHLAVARNASFSLTGVDEPVRVAGAVVSADTFPLLGVNPSLGRGFLAAEDLEGAERVVVLSHGLWQRRFGADPAILNKRLVLDGQNYTVVGVMPARFKFWGAELWVPAGLNFDGELHRSRVARTGYFVVGRLKPGLTPAQGEADLKVIAQRLGQAYPDTNKDTGVKLTPLIQNVTRNIRPALLVLLAAVGFVLLIACANVANLLLARAMTREKEMAVRAALGAGRRRLTVQLLLESLPLALLGGAAGLGLAVWGTKTLLAFIPPGSIPSEAEVRIDWRVLLFTLGIALLTAMIFGLIPALQTSRGGLDAGLREGSRSSTGGLQSHRARSLLVVTETALSLALLVAAGLLMRSFNRLQQTQIGFNPQRVLQLQIGLAQTRYPQLQQSSAFFQQALDRLRALPGVATVGACSCLPFSGNQMGMPLVLDGRTYEEIRDLSFTQYNLVMGDYFRAMGIAVRAGRPFTAEDTKTSVPVAIINQTLASQHFRNQNPIGKRIKLGAPDNLNREGLLGKQIIPFPWHIIVGVVDDVKQGGFTDDSAAQAYIPYVQAPEVPQIFSGLMLVARTTGEPGSLIPAARAEMTALDKNQPITRISSMETLLTDSLRQPRFSMLLLSLFAAVALVLSAIGIYGVISYSVSQRTREVGLRMALGAQKSDVLALVLRHGMRLVGVGLAAGLAVTLGLTRFLASLLYGVSATDPVTVGGVLFLLATVALLACYIPAWRATRLQPMTALRCE